MLQCAWLNHSLCLLYLKVSYLHISVTKTMEHKNHFVLVQINLINFKKMKKGVKNYQNVSIQTGSYLENDTS